ncbi:helix-turn-helix domain-containing protein [Kordiimonas sp. SCSIO 12610]|uniref:helix-turn-helix domain-containing protein n=1 Tax=Kordiimonas sp. SCSIO 12610 TaxID=2829597 RepID=UPI00210A7DF2|nr:helix-turn-helix domain-containing protein [Kordiimonas sp. SCSIO 12610]UTW54824.1 helix-turn-helix domain-containing protein [Kordiimonas sp. SCSIO 12610]
MPELKRPMINEALTLVRLYWGYSQIELSNLLSLSQSLISDIERGSKPVTMEVLERYSERLNIRMSQLLFFAEEMEGEPPVRKGKLIVAQKALSLLEKLSPAEVKHH